MLHVTRWFLLTAGLAVAPALAANYEYIVTCERALVDRVVADAVDAGYTIRARSDDGETILVAGPRNLRLLRRLLGVRDVEPNQRVTPPR